MEFICKLRRNAPESNPDYTTVRLEAKDEKAARKQLDALIADDNWKPGWFSTNEGEELWAKADGIEILTVERG